jgi:DNA-binding transcriptional regulator YdaS (Cro superfamily)
LQSDHTNELYIKLGSIATNVEQALLSQDYQQIASLLSEHQKIMNQISVSETTVNQSMKPAIEEAEKHVLSLISKIRDMQNDIKQQLTTMNNKRLIQSAYHV